MTIGAVLLIHEVCSCACAEMGLRCDRRGCEGVCARHCKRLAELPLPFAEVDLSPSEREFRRVVVVFVGPVNPVFDSGDSTLRQHASQTPIEQYGKSVYKIKATYHLERVVPLTRIDEKICEGADLAAMNPNAPKLALEE